MLIEISIRLTDFFYQKGIVDTQKKELFIYGFQLILSTAASMLSILLASAALNINYGMIYLFFFYPIRFCIGGFHASTYAKCYILTTLSFAITLLISRIIFLNGMAFISIFGGILSIISIYSIDPCINKNNPLTQFEIQQNKHRSHILLFLYLVVIILLFKVHIFYAIIALNTLLTVCFLFFAGLVKNHVSM